MAVAGISSFGGIRKAVRVPARAPKMPAAPTAAPKRTSTSPSR